MSTPQEAIIHALAVSRRMFEMYLQDLKPEEYLHRPCPSANCAAWVVGHLALSDRSALKRLGVNDLPALPDGFEKRFARDAEAPGKEDFGDVSILWPLFAKHRDMLIEAVKNASTASLDKPLEKPHPLFANHGQLASFMAVHSAMHAGQITMIRRSLGRPPIV